MGENKTPTAAATEKLQKELETATKKNDRVSIKVLSHLIERVKESEALAEDVCQEHKSYEKCDEYINKLAEVEAKKQKRSGRVCVQIDDPVVYEWAEDYYHLDDKAKAEKEAKEKADRIAKAKSSAKKTAETNATVSVVKVHKSDEKCTENEKSAQKAPESVQKPAESAHTAPKKKNDQLEGQMDLFSLFGM